MVGHPSQAGRQAGRWQAGRQTGGRSMSVGTSGLVYHRPDRAERKKKKAERKNGSIPLIR